jgi:hypothetical protein
MYVEKEEVRRRGTIGRQHGTTFSPSRGIRTHTLKSVFVSETVIFPHIFDRFDRFSRVECSSVRIENWIHLFNYQFNYSSITLCCPLTPHPILNTWIVEFNVQAWNIWFFQAKELNIHNEPEVRNLKYQNS